MSDVLLKEMEGKVFVSEKEKMVAKGQKDKLEKEYNALAQGTKEADQLASDLGSVMAMLKENQNQLRDSNHKTLQMIE